MSKLTHTTDDGSARMVDVSHKAALQREAVAEGFISMTAETLRLVRENEIAKGDVLTVAHIAGIQAAKQTAVLIPLCHQLPLSAVHVAFELRRDGIAITARAKTIAGTGVEMEALTAVSVAALTIYDMCKAVDKAMVISSVRLVEKTKRQLS